jgi:hypothetical protein
LNALKNSFSPVGRPPGCPVFLQAVLHRLLHPGSPVRLACCLVTIFFSLCWSPALFGQVTIDSNATHIIAPADTTTRTREKDIVDVVRQLFRLNPSTKSDVIKPGDKPVISALPAVGYTLQTKFAAIIAGNIAFFTKNVPQAKLSVVNAMVTYTQNKQFTIPIFFNVWLKGDQYYLLGDWRYMKYPQSSFGLGSDTHLETENPMNYKYIRFYQYFLRKVTPNFSAGLGYAYDYHWDISQKGPADGSISDFTRYGPAIRTTSAGPAAMFLYDTRNNPINPLHGLAASLVLRTNIRDMGSNTNWQSATIDIRKYIHFPAGSRNVLAFWNYDWLILHGKPPYLDLPSNGWDNFNNTGRGFIQGRYRGNKMVYLESEYRFQLTSNGLLGGVLFVNAETFSGSESNNLQSIQPAAGFGLRIKLNKKSKTNICIDYGFGTEGMKGLFVNVGEVF